MEEKVKKILKELNIKVHESYQMQEWNNGKWLPGHKVTYALFQKIKSSEEETQLAQLEMNCCVRILEFFYHFVFNIFLI